LKCSNRLICKLKTTEEGVIIKIKNDLQGFDEEIHEKLLKDGWRELRPKSIMGQLPLLIPIMIINLLIVQFIMRIFTQTSGIADYQISGTIQNTEDLLKYALPFLVMAIVLIVVHELIHLLFIPNFIKSDNTYIGLTYYGGCVYTTDVLSKYRACLIYIAPFVFLSIILNVISGVLGLYNIPLMIFIILNSIGSSGEILELILILLQVPKGAKIVNNGMRTYFRVPLQKQDNRTMLYPKT